MHSRHEHAPARRAVTPPSAAALVTRLVAALLLACAGGCAPGDARNAEAIPEKIELRPDYAGLVIPPNIAPLVCEAGNEGDDVRYTLASFDGRVAIHGEGRTINPPIARWRELLEAGRGRFITLDVSVERGGKWFRLAGVTNHVAQEPIDPALVYRVIPPSYEHYNKLTINQRDLTSFEERTLYSNLQVSRKQCINCHTFKDRDGRYFAFHARNELGGTVIFKDGKPPAKVDLKCGDLYSSGVYPAWHPVKENLMAFSVNKTAQIFYMTRCDKIEVLDGQSGLILYDSDKNQVTAIEMDDRLLATYPEWSPDGATLYYNVAAMKNLPPARQEDERMEAVALQVTNMHYSLVCRSFDAATGTFGPPRLLIDGAKSRASIAFPRVSPDGIHIMMNVLGFANFPVWHKESDLWLFNTVTGRGRIMSEVNSADADSYHAWGSNGRWFVFGSRRDDGVHTRPYLAYFDPATETAGKPFLVPQANPRFYDEFFYSFNRPELLRIPVPYSPEEIRQAVMQPASKASLAPPR